MSAIIFHDKVLQSEKALRREIRYEFRGITSVIGKNLWKLNPKIVYMFTFDIGTHGNIVHKIYYSIDGDRNILFYDRDRRFNIKSVPIEEIIQHITEEYKDENINKAL